MTATGTVFDIQGYSLHDGPGLRTVVFLKGCPLRCVWCSNPESQEFGREAEFVESRCTRCGTCLDACARGAINTDLGVKSGHKIVKSVCDECGECARACPTRALRLVGDKTTADELLVRITRDRAYYRRSGGGVTLSGGEPLAQPDFARDILRECYRANIHTAIETAGHVPWDYIETVLPFTDLVLYDIKHMDDALHRKATGVPNSLIIDNAVRIAQTSTPLIIRVPLVPGFNSTAQNLEATGAFASELGAAGVHLLPLHHLGKDKYSRLGREYEALTGRGLVGDHDHGRDSLVRAKETLGRYGIDAQIGG